jgi:DNA-binding beta-propeller fold protein YncE
VATLITPPRPDRLHPPQRPLRGCLTGPPKDAGDDTPGFGNGQFNNPIGIAVDPGSGDVYVLDNSGGFGNEGARVQKFDAAGNFLLSWVASYFEGNQVAADPATGDLYVTDSSNNQVLEFDPSGNQIAAFASQGTGTGQFNEPHTITVDPSDGDLYVADDTVACRVQKFDSSFTFLFQFGGCGSGDGQFGGGGVGSFEIFGPAGMAVDPATGDVYAVDWGNNRGRLGDDPRQFTTRDGSAGVELRLALDLPSRVLPEPNPSSCGRNSHGMPVYRTNKMPERTLRSSSRLRHCDHPTAARSRRR